MTSRFTISGSLIVITVLALVLAPAASGRVLLVSHARTVAVAKARALAAASRQSPPPTAIVGRCQRRSAHTVDCLAAFTSLQFHQDCTTLIRVHITARDPRARTSLPFPAICTAAADAA